MYKVTCSIVENYNSIELQILVIVLFDQPALYFYLIFYLCFFQDPSVQKVGGGRKKTVSFSSMPSEKKVD